MVTVSERKDEETRDLRREVADQIQSRGIRQVRVATVDLNGIPRAKMVSAEEFTSRVIEKGHPWALPLVAVDIWQNLPDRSGFGEEIGFGNGVLKPDLTTFRQLPWAPETGHVFGDVFTREGQP